MEANSMKKGRNHKPVLRGGSWNNNDNNCRVANRNNNNPDNRNNNNGLRILNAIKSIYKPEPVRDYFTGSANWIAQNPVLTVRSRMNISWLVGQVLRKPLFNQCHNHQGGLR